MQSYNKRFLNEYKRLQNKYYIITETENVIQIDLVSLLIDNYIIININLPRGYPFVKPKFGITFINLPQKYKTHISKYISKYIYDNDIINKIFSYIDNSIIEYNNVKEVFLRNNNYNNNRVFDYDDIIDNIKINTFLDTIVEQIIVLI
jgi:hypothetical protein